MVDTFKEVTDSGTLYITNKRIIFVGTKKNVTYPLNKVVNFIKYRDAVQFQKENEARPKYFLRNHLKAPPVKMMEINIQSKNLFSNQGTNALSVKACNLVEFLLRAYCLERPVREIEKYEIPGLEVLPRPFIPPDRRWFLGLR